MFDRFGLRFGADLASQMEPGGRLSYAHRPWAIQDGLGIILVRSFFRLTVWVHLFKPLGLPLGSSWVASGFVLGNVGVSWASVGSS